MVVIGGKCLQCRGDSKGAGEDLPGGVCAAASGTGQSNILGGSELKTVQAEQAGRSHGAE